MRARLITVSLWLAVVAFGTTSFAQPKGKTKPGTEPPAAADAGAPAAAEEATPTEAKPGETKPGEEAPKEEPKEAPKEEPSKPGVADTRSEGMKSYLQALEKRRLAATAPLSRQRLREELGPIEEKIADGRRDEAIGDLVYLVESPRFAPFQSSEEGRAALFLLGDSLGRGGAYEPARGYLLRLLSSDSKDTYFRRSARSLVELGLQSGQYDVFLADLKKVPSSAPEELRGDIAYLEGRAAERHKQPDAALSAYAKVTPRSRFWAQATYLSGAIEVERGKFKRGENLFCKVADPKLTPKKAPLFGGSDFFRVRDLARLGLGRIAHEKYRFGDSRYYYYLVPKDSDHLPEALYESATGRYEAKDYDGARELMDELRSLKVNHPYEDEAWVLDAYIDLASCRFFRADAKLQVFLSKYDPVRDAARKISNDDTAVKRLVESVREGSDPAAAGLGVKQEVARTLGALLRLDAEYGVVSRRLAQMDIQLSGLRGAMGELDESSRRLATPKGVRPQAIGGLGDSIPDKVDRIDAQLAEVRRLLREAERTKGAGGVAELQKQLEALEIRARAARAGAGNLSSSTAAKSGTTDADLSGVIQKDRDRAVQLYADASKVREKVEREQVSMARDALKRLDKRLSRLLRRARLGRIETVLGKKRSLEVEIEALSQGLLPQTVVDSLKAERYLGDDEEYWPFDGEDWEDEYVGGEGLR